MLHIEWFLTYLICPASSGLMAYSQSCTSFSFRVCNKYPRCLLTTLKVLGRRTDVDWSSEYSTCAVARLIRARSTGSFSSRKMKTYGRRTAWKLQFSLLIQPRTWLMMCQLTTHRFFHPFVLLSNTFRNPLRAMTGEILISSMSGTYRTRSGSRGPWGIKGARGDGAHSPGRGARSGEQSSEVVVVETMLEIMLVLMSVISSEGLA